ncbi:MAG: leucine-rich repeat domain-containing protein, partial [bacterium]
MRVTLMPDPCNLEAISTNEFEVVLFLRSLGLSRDDARRWREPHEIDFDPETEVNVSGLAIRMPDHLLEEKEWRFWSMKDANGCPVFGVNGSLLCLLLTRHAPLGLLDSLSPDLPGLIIGRRMEPALLDRILRLDRLQAVMWSGGDESLDQAAALTGLPGLRCFVTWNCERLRDVRGLAALRGLTYLDLGECAHLRDLSGLEGLSHLTSLKLNGCCLPGTPCFTEDNLEPEPDEEQAPSRQPPGGDAEEDTLAAARGYDSLADLTPLAGLVNLKRLDLYGCEALRDLRPLTGLVSLEQLDLHGCPAVSDLRPLANLKNLKSLDLSCCLRMHDLSPLSELTELTDLGLGRCALLDDLSP